MDEIALAWLLWGALSILLYTYGGYPLVLAMVGRRDKGIPTLRDFPKVSVVVAAHNEERCMAQKVRNVLEHDYPPDRLELIVVSDGSTDRTEAIVHALDEPRVRLMRQPQQQGKNAALNRGIAVARGDVVVFTDASALLTPGALQRLLAPFREPAVGLVSGQGYYGTLGNDTTQVVSNAYVRYESFIKRHEASLGFIAAADGALYAMRRELCRALPVTQVHDLLHPIDVAREGYRSVFVPEAFTVEPPSHDAKSEYRRHVRIIAQGIVVFLAQTPRLLSQGCFTEWWMLLSHRFLRWISSMFLLVAFVANVALARSHPIYAVLMTGQLAFYTLALGGAVGERRKVPLRLLAVPYYFCVVSLAGFEGALRFLSGRKQAAWVPTGGAR